MDSCLATSDYNVDSKQYFTGTFFRNSKVEYSMDPKKSCYISGRGASRAGMRLLMAVALVLSKHPSPLGSEELYKYNLA